MSIIKKGIIRSIKASISISLMALLCCLFFISCKSEDSKEVNIAFFPNITHSQALVMKHDGLLEEFLGEEHTVNWHQFNAGPEEIEAMFAGSVDIGYIGPTPAISGNVRSNGDIIIISGAADAGAMLMAAPDDSIQSVADLAGRKVAIPQLGNTQHLNLLDLLDRNNLTTLDTGGNVEIIATSNADILNLMLNGAVDAALVPEPWATILQNQCDAKILLDEKEVWRDGDYPTAVVIVRKEFLNEQPQVVEAFLRAHKQATDFINQNKQEAMAIVNRVIEEGTGKAIDTNVLSQAFERLIISTNVNEEAVKDFADISLKEGYIESLPTDDFIQQK